jgi:hypothetical protein
MPTADRSHKRSWSRPLADLVGAAMDPVLARQGFGESDLILYWEDIVGARLAAMSEPIKLRWPPRGRSSDLSLVEPATLVIRVESGFALEMQHLADAVLERVNAHLGWKCVGRIALKQGPLGRQRSGKAASQGPSPAARASAEEHVSTIEDATLREALARLGAYVIERTAAEGEAVEQTAAQRPPS